MNVKFSNIMPPHYNQSFIDFHQKFFQGCIFIATFGASITFQVIIQQLDNQILPKEPHKIFDYNQAQSFLAWAWLMFISAMGMSSLSLALLALNEGGKKYFETFAIFSTFILQNIMFGAFLLSALAVSAYSFIPGFFTVAIVGVFWIVSFVLWIVFIP